VVVITLFLRDIAANLERNSIAGIELNRLTGVGERMIIVILAPVGVGAAPEGAAEIFVNGNRPAEVINGTVEVLSVEPCRTAVC
jgi:hypothetical protein